MPSIMDSCGGIFRILSIAAALIDRFVNELDSTLSGFVLRHVESFEL